MLRQLLRAVDRNVTVVAGNKQWREYILQQARSSAMADPAALQEQLQLARDYTLLIENVVKHRVSMPI